MNRQLMVAVAVVVALVAPAALDAHEGHAHKIMGTVSVIHENHLEIKGTDGKVSTVTLNEKTKILRDKTAMKAADIKVGDRVVVTATETKDKAGKATLLASEVRLGTAAPTKTS